MIRQTTTFTHILAYVSVYVCVIFIIIIIKTMYIVQSYVKMKIFNFNSKKLVYWDCRMESTKANILITD